MRIGRGYSAGKRYAHEALPIVCNAVLGPFTALHLAVWGMGFTPSIGTP